MTATTFANADLGDGTWSYELETLDALAFPDGDGEYEIVVRALDGSGKSLERRLLLYVDNHAPVVLVKVPTGYASGQYNGDFSIKGEAADEYGIDRVELEIWNSTGTALLLGPEVVVGTSSWSYLFKSKDLLPSGTAVYQLRITAFDRSDNTNAYLYHDDDVYAANGGTVTVEQVYSLDQGVAVSGLTILPADMAALKKTALTPSALTLTVNQALDLPDFIISNPDEEAPLAERVLGSNANAIGMVLDDDGVDPDSIQISLDRGLSWVDVTQTGGSGISVRWQHDLSGLGGGTQYLRLRAQDIYGIPATCNEVQFSIDLGAPSVEVTSPVQGSYQKATFWVQGTSFDSEGVASVKVSTNGGANYYNAANTGVGFSTWEYSAAVPGDGLTDGNRTVKVMATDTSGKSGYTNLQVIIDTQDPSINFLIPASSSTVNGEVLLRGTASDNTQVTKVELKIGRATPGSSCPAPTTGSTRSTA